MARRWLVVAIASFLAACLAAVVVLANRPAPPSPSPSPQARTAPDAVEEGDDPPAPDADTDTDEQAEDAPPATPLPEDFVAPSARPKADAAELAEGSRSSSKVDPHLAAAAAKDQEKGDGYVAVSATATRSGAELLDDLEGLGLLDGSATNRTVTGRLPSDKVDEAAELESLRYIRRQWTVSSTGLVAGQGDKALKGDVARETFGVTGKGVTVGVLSDSFDCHDGYQDDIESGDLPEGIKVIKEGDCDIALDEGRAMAQIIADVAPEAKMIFRTVQGSPIAMRNGIRDLVRAGADVIVDDIGYVDEPWFQDGIAARAVDAAEERGVAFFSAAGNSGDDSYEGPFDDAGKGITPETRSHDFDRGSGVDTTQRVTIPARSGALIVLQWTDNFKAQTNSGPAPKTDLDFFAFTGDELVGASFAPNRDTLEPFEAMLIPNLGKSALNVDLVIERVAGPDPRFVKWISMLGDVKVREYATPTSTIVGHSQAAGVISVGASSFKRTPVYGTSPARVNDFSSRGSTPIFIGKDGQLLGQAFKRRKPDIVAPDNVNTTFFGIDSDADKDKLPNFSGTSAAAPHAAGVAALLLEKVPKADATDVCNALTATALEMDEKGFDFATGHGFVDAHATLKWLKKPGRDGPCPAKPIDVNVKLPAPEPVGEVPKPSVAPQPVEPQVVEPAPPTLPPTPKPAPPTALLFVDEQQVAAGDKVSVSGWYFPKSTQVDISLDGERPLGSVQSNSEGRLAKSMTIPTEVTNGSYKVVASGGGAGPVSAARPLVVYQPTVVRSAAEVAAAAPVGGQPSGSFFSGRLVVATLLALLLGVLIVVLFRLPSRSS